MSAEFDDHTYGATTSQEHPKVALGLCEDALGYPNQRGGRAGQWNRHDKAVSRVDRRQES